MSQCRIADTLEVESNIVPPVVLSSMEDTASAQSIISFEEELPVARHVYQAAKTIVQNAMHDTRLGRAINSDDVNRVAPK